MPTKKLLYSYIVSLLLLMATCGPVLNNFPITFKMSGATTYIPDSGGVTRDGYKLTLGFSYYQWLAVEIVTGNNKNDVLVVQVDQFYTEGSTSLRNGHQVSVQDYFRSGDSLTNDQNNQYDISSFSYVQSKSYQINLTRYLGSNSGEDWNAVVNKYSLMQACFYTSEKLFSADTWNTGLKQCYFFQIDNLYSKFKGVKLKNFYLNGYTTGIYGWIDGPYVTDNVYFYQQVPLFSYTKQPAIIIEIGTTSGEKGQDFNAHSPISSQTGDYYGPSTTNLTKDTVNSGGFENNGLLLQHWNAVPSAQISGLSMTALRITYSRNVTTFDKYDKNLKSTFIFCLYLYTVGSINSVLTDKSCQAVQLSYHYPRMNMPIKLWQITPQSIYQIILLLLFLLNL